MGVIITLVRIRDIESLILAVERRYTPGYASVGRGSKIDLRGLSRKKAHPNLTGKQYLAQDLSAPDEKST